MSGIDEGGVCKRTKNVSAEGRGGGGEEGVGGGCLPRWSHLLIGARVRTIVGGIGTKPLRRRNAS